MCRRFLFEAVLLARKCGLICIAVLVPDPFLATLLSLLSSVCVWALAIVWKPTKQQLQLRSLQAALLSLHALMLLQASGHAQPMTMTVLHALWLALLCVVLCVAVYSLGVRTPSQDRITVFLQVIRYAVSPAACADSSAQAVAPAADTRARQGEAEEFKGEGGGQGSLHVHVFGGWGGHVGARVPCKQSKQHYCAAGLQLEGLGEFRVGKQVMLSVLRS
ncbi:MAG: hypothetical protein P4L87_10800 [Formivibrio sp.]|nr:hypothetical protein [Formivibrio sp.]